MVHASSGRSPSAEATSMKVAPSPDEVVAAVTHLLRRRGERMTGPRRIVLTALAQSPDHLSAEEVTAAVVALDPTVHRSSVYRTLEALTHLGVLQHVHAGHGPTTYHLMPQSGPHPHAQCRVCGTVRDLPADLLDAVAGRLAHQEGFTLDMGHVALSGTCVQCAGHQVKRSGDAMKRSRHSGQQK